MSCPGPGHLPPTCWSKEVWGTAGERSILAAADGSRVPAYPLFEQPATGRGPGAVALVVTDLREQKRNEAIVAEGKLCSEILLQTEQPIIVCDPHGRIIRTNKRAMGGLRL